MSAARTFYKNLRNKQRIELGDLACKYKLNDYDYDLSGKV